MKNNRTNIFQLLLAVLLLITFGLEVVNTAMNLHSHLLKDGRFVSHAHAMANSAEHDHSDAEFFAIEQAQLHFFEELSSFTFFTKVVLAVERPYLQLRHKKCIVSRSKSRAPPAA